MLCSESTNVVIARINYYVSSKLPFANNLSQLTPLTVDKCFQERKLLQWQNILRGNKYNLPCYCKQFYHWPNLAQSISILCCYYFVCCWWDDHDVMLCVCADLLGGLLLHTTWRMGRWCTATAWGEGTRSSCPRHSISTNTWNTIRNHI